MIKNLSLPWWVRWLPSATHSISLTGTGVELLTRTGTHNYDWKSIDRPPVMGPLWFFHLVSISTPGGTWRLYFRTKQQRDSAWREIVRAWYVPRIIDTQKRLRYFEQLLLDNRYIRSSKWQPLKLEVLSWGASQPPIPLEGVIDPEHRAVLIKASKLLRQPDAQLEEARDRYVERALLEHDELFDKVESKPLSPKQRRACVIDEDNNLILAGAGTGKTSTVIGRVAFLVKSGQAAPEDILLLAYGNKAAEEMRVRLESKLGIKGITAATFHALGRCIVEKAEGKKPAVSDMATNEKLKAKFVDGVFEENQKEPAYRQLLLTYFERWLHPVRNPFDFKTLGDYYRFLEDNDVRTLKGELVKGFGECDIANFLFKNGVEYRYEASYYTPLQSPDRATYRPDFFLPELGIYIEHFGTDRQGNTAPYVDRDKYHLDMAWKRMVHSQGGTRLIETFHYEKQEGVLLKVLEQRLIEAGVMLNPLPPEAVLETLREFGAIKKFSVILTDMLGLLRAANLSAREQVDLIEQSAHPEQISAALTLLAPIIMSYERELERDEKVDFDDMINKANKYVLDGTFKSPWKFIVVDEFQDIAKSRADLVQALRKRQQDVSLFCVGDDWQDSQVVILVLQLSSRSDSARRR